MSTGVRKRETLDDLLKVDGKAELIDGRIIHFMASGFWPNRVAARVFRRLDDYADATGRGYALTDNIGFAVTRLASGRQSFSPDASYYDGPPPPRKMRFIEGPPTFAVEVRSENDRGSKAEVGIAYKRSDYFEAGTLVVWDVDPEAEVVRCYRSDAPSSAVEFRPGDIADAEPAVPGWRLAIDDLFA